MSENKINQKKASEIIGCSAITVRVYTKAGKLKVIRQAGKCYYDEKEVIAFAEKLEVEKKAKEEKESKPKKVVKPKLKELAEEKIQFTDMEEFVSGLLPNEDLRQRDHRKKIFDLMEKEPPKSWLKPIEGQLNKKGEQVMDLPIEKVEFLLSYIYTWWELEIKEVKQIFKESISVTVRINYFDLTGDRRYVDGIGAVHIPIEMDVQKMIPKASALATKNAAKKLGKIFGRDVNRDVYEVKENKEKKPAIFYSLKKAIEQAKGHAELEDLKPKVEELENEELTALYVEKEFLIS